MKSRKFRGAAAAAATNILKGTEPQTGCGGSLDDYNANANAGDQMIGTPPSPPPFSPPPTPVPPTAEPAPSDEP